MAFIISTVLAVLIISVLVPTLSAVDNIKQSAEHDSYWYGHGMDTKFHRYLSVEQKN